MPLLATLGVAAPAAAPVVPVESFRRSGAARRGNRRFPPDGNRGGREGVGTIALAPGDRVDFAPPSLDPDVALAQSLAGEAQDAPTAQIDGELSLDHASLAALLSLPLGAPQPPKPGATWSEATFRPPLVDPPPLDLTAEHRRARRRRRPASAWRDGALEDGSGKVRRRRIGDGRRRRTRLGQPRAASRRRGGDA